MSAEANIVLGSRSPRRLELLRLIVPEDRIVVRPPRSAEEPGFEGAGDWPEIENRLAGITRTKADDVAAQCTAESAAAVVTADTVIVAEDDNARLIVLGQPPEDDWPSVVRDWFLRLLLSREHTAATAFRVTTGNSAVDGLVKTRVRFSDCDDELLEWYIRTGEPRGKAGGYAIQGAGGDVRERSDRKPEQRCRATARRVAQRVAPVGNRRVIETAEHTPDQAVRPDEIPAAAMRVGNRVLPSRYFLAPLAGYTHLAFRRAIRELGGIGLCTTDLVLAGHLVRGTRKSRRLVTTDEHDRPLSVQIFGHQPGEIVAAARWLEDHGYGGVDLNMGCPMGKINKAGGGARLMCDAEATAELVTDVVNAVDVPVTVKMRLGWDRHSITATDAGAGVRESRRRRHHDPRAHPPAGIRRHSRS